MNDNKKDVGGKGLTLETLKYYCRNHEDQRGFFQFE